MRIFWGLLATLMVAGVVMLWLEKGERAATAKMEPEAPAPELRVEPRASTPVPAPTPSPTPTPTPKPETKPQVQPETKPGLKVETAPATTPAAPEAPRGDAPVAPKPDEKPSTAVEAPSVQPMEAATTKPAPAENKPAADAKPAAVAAAEHAIGEAVGAGGEAAGTGDAKPADPKLAARAALVAELTQKFPKLKAAVKDDGSLLIDERFAVTGAGTKEDPFEVPWDLLASVQEVYDPKRGQKEVPDRVNFLDGKQVKMPGYVAFPLYVEQPNELLSMLNQWDGCCIGVPPTPYDAIEVKLSKVVEADQRYATYGTVTGTFRVKPYLVGDWLVGLYMLEKSGLSDTRGGGLGQ